jgi:hypothetical protein
MQLFPSTAVPRGAAAVLRVIVNGIPATVAVVFAVLILFVGLFSSEARRRYALTAAARLTRTAVALIAPRELS